MITKKILTDIYQTGREMIRLVKTYSSDLGPWLDVPFIVFFNHVCKLPYFDDPEGVETVSRPKYLLDPEYRPRDCDDKSILCACWWHAHGVKCRFIAVSTQNDGTPNHVFLQLENGVDIDATYPEYQNIIGKYPYYPMITNRESLTGWI